jgi:hypothetical protein
MVAIKVANKVPKGAKTTPFGNQNPTEIPCFISGLRVAVKTAKPLCRFDIGPRLRKDVQAQSMPMRAHSAYVLQLLSRKPDSQWVRKVVLKG